MFRLFVFGVCVLNLVFDYKINCLQILYYHVTKDIKSSFKLGNLLILVEKKDVV